MNPDDFKQAWQGQSRLTIDAELLLQELQRNEQYFSDMIFWRDFREVGVSLLMVPLWLYLGVKNSSPWTWYLTVPVLLWVAGFMLADRIRHKRQPSEPGEPVRRHVWRVRWRRWSIKLGCFVMCSGGLSCLSPLRCCAFFGQVAWQERAGGWWTVLSVSMVATLGIGVLAGIYRLNLYAVRAELEPRRRELETLIMGLEDETTDANR